LGWSPSSNPKVVSEPSVLLIPQGNFPIISLAHLSMWFFLQSSTEGSWWLDVKGLLVFSPAFRPKLNQYLCQPEAETTDFALYPEDKRAYRVPRSRALPEWLWWMPMAPFSGGTFACQGHVRTLQTFKQW
jgi:hypothetical protein